MSPLAAPSNPAPRVRRTQSQASPLKRILRTHLHTFLDRSQGPDTPRSLPAHITRELHASVRCTGPTFGFAHLRCPACLFDQLIPFSCEGRGLGSSCAGRRMAAIAAHLSDHVLPDQPLRQWVLSLPWSLRIHLAFGPSLTRNVGRAFLRAVFASYMRRARLAGYLNPRASTSPLSHAPKAHASAINLSPALWLIARSQYSLSRVDPRRHLHHGRPTPLPDSTFSPPIPCNRHHARPCAPSRFPPDTGNWPSHPHLSTIVRRGV
ncbi:MAG: hypothetical protein GY930_15780 [bacterium]|nr:hypothetical protein [bacterium]